MHAAPPERAAGRILCYIYNFSGFSIGSCIKEEEGYLLPTYIYNYISLQFRLYVYCHGNKFHSTIYGFATIQPYKLAKIMKAIHSMT